MKLERNEYLWYKASLAALGNEYLSKNWEVKLYATSLQCNAVGTGDKWKIKKGASPHDQAGPPTII